MQSILILIDTMLSLYMWGIIIAAAMSWLTYGGVINTSNRFVHLVSDFLYRITEPALRPIRRIVPYIGGIDLSPIILILLIFFLRNLLHEYGGSLL
ncbi:MAG: YggT family protein [Rhodospirillales bacterium]|nr:YggT family protein [Rhodospirillales bacterium]